MTLAQQYLDGYGMLTTGSLLEATAVMMLLKNGVLAAYCTMGPNVGSSAETNLCARGSFATTCCNAPAHVDVLA